MMAQLVYFKEWLTTLYKRHVEIILPILKLLFAFFALSMFQRMFYYNECIDKPWVFLAVSAVQAFLPISFLYYAISILIMINLWNVYPCFVNIRVIFRSQPKTYKMFW